SRAAGGGCHVEAVVGGASDDTIVIDKAVIAKEHTVAAPADSEARPVVDVHPVHEGRGIFADDFDFAESRGVEYSATLAGSQAFTRHGAVHVFAGAGEVAGAFPEADVLK